MKRLKKIARYIIGAHLIFVVLTGAIIFAYRWVNPPTTLLMTLSQQPKQVFIALEDIPPCQQAAFVLAEDDAFFRHYGFNIPKIRQAINLGLDRGVWKVGGSSISQQTARTLFLYPWKSFVRKYFEALLTIEMELLLPKSRILELYLNYAEFGPGVFGLEAAARHYFDIPTGALRREQIYILVSALPNPAYFASGYKYYQTDWTQRSLENRLPTNEDDCRYGLRE